MIGALRTPEQQTVTVFGGSGFLGRYVVSRLAERGYRVLVPTRQPNLANFLPLGKVGQINPIHANLRNEDSVAHAVARAEPPAEVDRSHRAPRSPAPHVLLRHTFSCAAR